jgi:LacI family transcriptional regulator
MKVISFSSLEIAPLLNPSLTTITQPALDMGRESAILLFKVLENLSDHSIASEEKVLKSKIIRRKSTC